MKRILACLSAALFAFGVNAATLLPIQLLNPTGSTSGQTIVSTGASTAPAWGGVPVSGLAAIAANTVLANATASSASPTAFAMPSCATALEWTSGTGFVCNTAGAFTTLSATGLISPTSTIGIKGTATNDSPAAGSVGENPSSGVSITLAGMTTAVPVNFGSISLAAGDWMIYSSCVFQAANTTTLTLQVCSINTVSATILSVLSGQTAEQALIWPTTGSTNAFGAPVVHLKFASTTTVFLVGQANFTASTLTGGGLIWAIRIR